MRSRFDPTRDTVGTIARDLVMNADRYPVIVGDMTNEIEKDLVTDLNEAFASNPYKDEPFYVVVHEAKDLQQTNMIKRKVITMPFRPWPEDDTIVFYYEPRKQEILFCWCLPHWSEMDNMLANPDKFEVEMLEDIKAWKNYDLSHFGFLPIEGKFTEKGEPLYAPNRNFKDRPLKKRKSV